MNLPVCRKVLAERGWTACLWLGVLLLIGLFVGQAAASTYVVYIPLDSPIYDELQTLSDLGSLDSYLGEIKPISRVEAARLTLEAQELIDSGPTDPLARQLVKELREQLHDEVGWLVDNAEDAQPPVIFHPVERLEMQYVFSSGSQRSWSTGTLKTPSDAGLNADEGTPLLPNNDGLPTGAGSNEIVRWSGWFGLGGFLTGYGEGAIAGPLTHSIQNTSRLRPLGTAMVASLGNTAISVGTEEMWWGVGRFSALSQSDNAQPFAAVRMQNIHPTLLPGILRYLGQFRYQVFFGQLDDNRYFAHPWIDGQIVSFKPMPNFEFGFNHTIDFGGRHNDNYSAMGFIGRATGFATGNPKGANTNSRVGAYAKLIIPRVRNTQLYAEILGEDFYQPFGGSIGIKTPFKAPSYTFGVYAPRLTADGLTDIGAEYTLLDRVYSAHEDSLYWTSQNELMGDPLGPGAWRVNAEVGRWLNHQTKGSAEFFFERRSLIPSFVKMAGPGGSNESSFGGALSFLRLPFKIRSLEGSLGEVKAAVSVQYVEHVNYSTHNSVRSMVQLSFGLAPSGLSFQRR